MSLSNDTPPNVTDSDVSTEVEPNAKETSSVSPVVSTTTPLTNSATHEKLSGPEVIGSHFPQISLFPGDLPRNSNIDSQDAKDNISIVDKDILFLISMGFSLIITITLVYFLILITVINLLKFLKKPTPPTNQIVEA